MKKLISAAVVALALLLAITCIPSLAEGNSDWRQVRSQVMPQLVSSHKKEVLPIVHTEFTTSIDVAYVVDKGDTYDFIMQEQLEGWDIDAKAVHKRAVKNVEKLHKEEDLSFGGFKSGRPQYAVIETEDGYAAARIVSPKFRKALSKELGVFEMRAGAPLRDFLVVWDPAYDNSDEFAEQVRTEYNDGGTYRLSPAVLHVTPQSIEQRGIAVKYSDGSGEVFQFRKAETQ